LCSKCKEQGTPNERTREKIINEIVNTEKDYFDDLTVMIDCYYSPLVSSAILLDAQVETLFSNISFVKEVSAKVLQAMKDKVDSLAVDEPKWMVDMSDVFLSMDDHQLRPYTDYCTKQPLSLAMLKSLENNNPDFHTFLQKIVASEPKVRGLSLLSFLIKPVQRLCKYPLLLRELIHNTPPEHPGFPNLSKAEASMKATVAEVNEWQRAAETAIAKRQKEMETISQSVIGLDALKLTEDVNRELVYVGKIDIIAGLFNKHQPVQLLLFTDIVVFAAKGKLSSVVQVADMTLTNLADDTRVKHAFEIHDKKNDKKTICVVPNEEAKNFAMGHFKKLLKAHQKQLAKQMKIAKERRENNPKSMTIHSHRHALIQLPGREPGTAFSNGFTCSICNHLNPSRTKWHCVTCLYNMCELCLGKLLKLSDWYTEVLGVDDVLKYTQMFKDADSDASGYLDRGVCCYFCPSYYSFLESYFQLGI